MEVYFSESLDKILNRFDFSALGERVAIKAHFGEIGCVTYLKPELVRKVFDKIKAQGKNPTLVECNVLYKGSRVNASDHIKTAREHGFDMPIDILDGERGDEYLEIDGAKIGKGLENYDSFVVFSHFKGHSDAGFGGAIKNVGMGLGSRAGKLYMHSNIRPSTDSEKCTGCGTCIASCNAEAITIVDGRAVIDQDKCEGCAMCISVCNFKAIKIPWHGRTSDGLQNKIAEYTKAVLSRFKNPIFINVLQNITPLCDCMGVEQKPVMADVGFLASYDIVALDQASLDLANKYSQGQFDKINEVNKKGQIDWAEKYGLGSSQYKLVEL